MDRGPVLAPAADAYPETAPHAIVAHSWCAVVGRPANAVVGRSPHAAVIGSPPHAVVAAPTIVAGRGVAVGRGTRRVVAGRRIGIGRVDGSRVGIGRRSIVDRRRGCVGVDRWGYYDG